MSLIRITAFCTVFLSSFYGHVLADGTNERSAVDLSKLRSPILLRGDDTTAYRDPAVVYHEGAFHIFR